MTATGDERTAAAEHEEPAADELDAPGTGNLDEPGTENLGEPAAEDPEEPPVRRSRLRAGALPGGAAAMAGRLPLRWRITSMAVVGILAVAAVVSAVLLAIKAHHDDVAARAGTAARQAATAEIQQILTYDYRTLNTDLARAGNDTTGEFHQQFGTLSGQIIAPAAAQQQTVTRATVPNASVVSATSSQVVVLMFIDQSTSSRSQRQPQQVASQVRVTMQQDGGRWKVAQFQPL